MSYSNILIAGDSWGCGEWPHRSAGLPNGVVLHKGLEQYFLDLGFPVTNLSVAGYSNKQSIDALINCTNLDQFDKIYWIQTDPLREYSEEDFKNLQTFQQTLDYQRNFLKQSYARLNSLGREIICIGGCSPLDTELMSEFSNLIPLIKSVIEFLLPEFPTMDVWVSDWWNLVGRQFDLDSLDKFLYNKTLQEDLEKHKELFWPDGFHPNRFAWKIIFDSAIINNEKIDSVIANNENLFR